MVALMYYFMKEKIYKNNNLGCKKSQNSKLSKNVT